MIERIQATLREATRTISRRARVWLTSKYLIFIVQLILSNLVARGFDSKSDANHSLCLVANGRKSADEICYHNQSHFSIE